MFKISSVTADFKYNAIYCISMQGKTFLLLTTIIVSRLFNILGDRIKSGRATYSICLVDPSFVILRRHPPPKSRRSRGSFSDSPRRRARAPADDPHTPGRFYLSYLPNFGGTVRYCSAMVAVAISTMFSRYYCYSLARRPCTMIAKPEHLNRGI